MIKIISCPVLEKDTKLIPEILTSILNVQIFIIFNIQNRCGVTIPCKIREKEQIKTENVNSEGLGIRNQPQPSRPNSIATEGIASSTDYEIP